MSIQRVSGGDNKSKLEAQAKDWEVQEEIFLNLLQQKSLAVTELEDEVDTKTEKRAVDAIAYWSLKGKDVSGLVDSAHLEGLSGLVDLAHLEGPSTQVGTQAPQLR